MKKNYFSRLKSVMLLFCLMASYQFAYAQTTVSGKITDAETNEPIIGANVLVKGTTSGTVTDIDGNYQVEVPTDATILSFSFVGYTTKEVEIANQTTINVALATDVKMLDELVVVGYGKMEKKDVTGSMSSMREEDFNQGAMSSPDQLMQGRAAGVVITPSSGEPGGGVNIRVRGGTSLTASNEPLYVIDGFPVDNTSSDPGAGADYSASANKNPLSTLNPADIASIDILKDASATAIYGARGANGVIIITTKKGKEGKANVSYSALVGSSSIAKKLDVLSASDYKSATNSAGSSPLNEGASTDWQDAMTQTGIMTSHNLSVTGGTEKAQYRVSGGYFKQDGIIINSGVERFTVNMNLNQKISEKVRLGFTMQGSHVLDNNLPYGTGGATNGGVINNMLRISPLLPLDWEINDQLNKNPYLMAKLVRDNTKTNRMRASAFVEAELIEGLTAKFNVGGDLTSAKRTSHLPDQLLWVGTGNGQSRIRNNNLSNVLTEATLSYTKEFADVHRINMVGGYTYQKFTKEEFGVEASGFALDGVAEHNIEQASTIRATSYKEKSELSSWLARANYSFKDRYVVTATVRADGSSRFGANNKWGMFPSASVAWRISEEDFMSGNDLFSDLKLRAGWGVTGSQEIGNYRSLPIVSGDPGKSTIDANGNIITGIGLTNYANPDLKWEETAQANIGLDFELMRGRIYGTLDYYVKNTSNLLLELSAAQPAPVTTYLANIGEVKNTGFEFLIGSVNYDNNGFKWETTFNGAANKNEVVSIGDFEEINAGPVGGRGQTGQFSQIVRAGQPYGSFYGYQYLGTEAGEEVFSEEKQYIGSAQPDFTWGMNNIFSYKDLDFSVFLQGSHGAQVFNNTALEFSQLADLYGEGSTYNVMKSAVDEGSASASFSSRFVEDASFVRVANISLGYKFDMSSIKFIESLRVYATGQNLALFTNYSGYDPEVSSPAGGNAGSAGAPQVPSMGVDYNNYPKARSYQIGLSATF